MTKPNIEQFDRLRAAATDAQRIYQSSLLLAMEAQMVLATLIDRSTNRDKVADILQSVGATSVLAENQMRVYISHLQGTAAMLSQANGFTDPEDHTKPDSGPPPDNVIPHPRHTRTEEERAAQLAEITKEVTMNEGDNE